MKNFVRCVKKGGIREKIRVFCCRSLRGSVDWNLFGHHCGLFDTCRSLRGSVDWNSDGNILIYGKPESLPTRERGLKYTIKRKKHMIMRVAPYAGALIEMRRSLNMGYRMQCRSLRGSVDWNITKIYHLPDRHMSLPTRERGLKSLTRTSIAGDNTVAPYAGAWIEIGRASCRERGFVPV